MPHPPELSRFHNALRVLLNIDKHEFVGAGGEPEDWVKFRNTPHMYFIVCPDEVAAGLWAIVESRQEPAPDLGAPLAEALRDLLSRMREPGCAKHTLDAFLHGAGVDHADKVLRAYDVATGVRAATPVQHA